MCVRACVRACVCMLEHKELHKRSGGRVPHPSIVKFVVGTRCIYNTV